MLCVPRKTNVFELIENDRPRRIVSDRLSINSNREKGCEQHHETKVIYRRFSSEQIGCDNDCCVPAPGEVRGKRQTFVTYDRYRQKKRFFNEKGRWHSNPWIIHRLPS